MVIPLKLENVLLVLIMMTVIMVKLVMLVYLSVCSYIPNVVEMKSKLLVLLIV
jgi:hypothetical protein